MAGAGGADNFVLSWQDDFNALDTSTWELENFTYDGNQAKFAPQNATVANGELTIALTAVSDAAKPYVGVEMRSAKTITYGKVSARMRFSTGSGVVSGLMLFYTPFPNCDWNEIDIEHLGKSSDSSQFNAMQAPLCGYPTRPIVFAHELPGATQRGRRGVFDVAIALREAPSDLDARSAAASAPSRQSRGLRQLELPRRRH
jgi:Glycosyl hydrolases family 16